MHGVCFPVAAAPQKERRITKSRYNNLTLDKLENQKWKKKWKNKSLLSQADHNTIQTMWSNTHTHTQTQHFAVFEYLFVTFRNCYCKFLKKKLFFCSFFCYLLKCNGKRDVKQENDFVVFFCHVHGILVWQLQSSDWFSFIKIMSVYAIHSTKNHHLYSCFSSLFRTYSDT